MKRLPFALCLIVLLTACREEAMLKKLSLLSADAGVIRLSENKRTADVAVGESFVLKFSAAVNAETAANAITLRADLDLVPIAISVAENDRIVRVDPVNDLPGKKEYTLVITSELAGVQGEKFSGAAFSFRTAAAALEIMQWTLGDKVSGTGRITDAPLKIDLALQFNMPLNVESVGPSSISLSGPASPGLVFELGEGSTVLKVSSASNLPDLSKYKLVVNNDLFGAEDETFGGFEVEFYTAADPAPDFGVVPDAELLSLVQRQTFKYFWDFAHPSSGMARERNTSGEIVTVGGSGFGIMALIVGMERGFITRGQGLERMDRILTFLESADRFHGAWPHWLDGNTGRVVPFSANDNGGDLVETSFLVQGLLAFRQYLDGAVAPEKELIARINALWHTVEWNWYTRGGQHVLYWHWSPDKAWVMNHAIRGYNEALITYVLAAASPAYSIDASVYHEGWAAGGGIINNKGYFGFTLPLGPDYGGPLFFAHYSFLGLDPRTLSDRYADYWKQNVAHARINNAYSAANPKGYVGYSAANWGLTASDNRTGYSAHSPANDLGVITPSAALSSFPYTPDESMNALKFFYYTLGDRLWGPYGFYDAFNLTEGWTADSYLAIDQGPIVIMIENYRTGLLWNLFMSAPEIKDGLGKLNFTY